VKEVKRGEEDGLAGGSLLSAEEGRKTCTGSGEEVSGPRVSFRLWAEAFPRPFYIFFLFSSLFLFCFLISFIAFAYCIQFKSNQFQIFYKIQNNIPEQ
jgi:hypothetical protein